MNVDATFMRAPCLGIIRTVLGVCVLNAALAALLAWALPTPACAQGLMDVYRRAETQDAQYLAARKSLEAALEKQPQALAALLPTISLNASQGQQVGRASISDAAWIDRAPNTWSWTLQLNQPLLHGTNGPAYEQAVAQIEQAHAQMESARQDLILRCAQAYLDVLLAIETVQLTDVQLTALQEQLDLAERNFEAGTGTITDVHEARAKHAQTRSQRVAAVTDQAVKEAEIERLLGESMELNPMRLKASLPPLDRSLDAWHEAARANHPQVRAQKAAMDAARAEVSRNARAHWPTLDLTANLGTNYSSGSLGSPADLSTRVESHSLGVQLTLPVYAGGSTQSRVREALALQEKAAAELESAERAAVLQAKQAYLGVSNGQAQAEALRIAVLAGQNALEGNQIGYRLGSRISPDVLNAQQQLYVSVRDLNRARTDTVVQGLKLKAAAGLLRVDDLAAVEQLLEPAQ